MIPIQITCRGFSCTEAISVSIHKQVEKLQKFYKRILRCDVTVELSHRHRRNGRIFHIQIRLCLPHTDIIVSREPEKDQSHEVFSIALRDAFRIAKRNLEDEVRVRRGFVKKHKTKVRFQEISEDIQQMQGE